MEQPPPVRRRPWTGGVSLILVLLAAMWLLELLDTLLPVPLDTWGIQGRTGSGLVGIALAPFLHAGFGHLMANTLPFLVLGSLVAWPQITSTSFIIGTGFIKCMPMNLSGRSTPSRG